MAANESLCTKPNVYLTAVAILHHRHASRELDSSIGTYSRWGNLYTFFTAVAWLRHSRPQSLTGAVAISGWRLAIIFWCLSVFLLLSLMDETIVATALVTISIEFNDFQNSLWIVLGYTLTYLGFAVLASRLADVYGRRVIVLWGAFIFTAFSFGSGFAQSMNQLIAFRTLQGVGGSIMYSLSIICFPEMSPIHLLPLASSIVGVVLAIAGAIGPVLGGVITSYSTWRWIFWLNPPVAIPTMITLFFVWPKDTDETTRGSHLVHVTLSQVDFIGAALLLLFTTAFTFSIQEAGSRVYAWNTPVIIVLLTIAGVALVTLFVWSFILDRVQRFRNVAEILPWRILTDRVLVAAIVTTTMTGFTNLLLVIELPIYFQIVNVQSAVQAGVHLLPTVLAVAVGACVGGLISMKKNYTFYTIIIGNSLILIGAGIYSVTPVAFKVPHVLYGSQVIAGLGCGFTFCCTTMIISLNAEFKDHALAQGLISQARIVGGTLGVAMCTALFGTHLNALSGILSPVQISTLYRNPGYISQLTLLQQIAARQAFALSFNESMRICTYIAAASLVVSLFVWQRNPPSIEQRKNQLEAAMIGEYPSSKESDQMIPKEDRERSAGLKQQTAAEYDQGWELQHRA